MILAYRLTLISLLLVGLPLSGVLLDDKPLAPYFHFPPVQTLQHAGFAWPAFILVASVFAFILAGLLMLLRHDLHRGRAQLPSRDRDWPWWFWPALVALGISWLLAWTRFEWFAPFQAHTFTPLWLSYIVVVNGLSQRLTGRSLLKHAPTVLAGLFPLSALFWWYFEYLNRFVQNWSYMGVQHFTPIEYALHATLAFSTVLPAVMSTQVLLQVLLRPRPSKLSLPLTAMRRKQLGWVILLSSAVILATLGVLPNYLFPFLWVVPAMLLLGLQALTEEPRYLRELRRRGWQIVYLPALAALACGILWELWNVYSAAKWTYSLPLVDRFEIFEMPLLGYAGYLPFGIECAIITLLISTRPFGLAIKSVPATSSP